MRGAVAAAQHSPEEFLGHLFAPETDALYATGILWHNLTVLPLAVIGGSIIAGVLSKGSVRCSALGGMAPGVILTFASPLPFGGVEPPLGVPGVVAVIVASWAMSVALLRHWRGQGHLRL